ncbi:MAG TPA: DUF1634 domain-containing protein [Thermoplasmata archaeon]|nr:DUF1634 domain-containing protein [Thermoplasmata archaeon]
MIAPRVALDRMSRGLVALRRAVVTEVEDVNRLLSHVLRAGVLVAVGLIAFAFLLAWSGGGPVPDAAVKFRAIPSELLRLTPAGFLSLGIVVLVLTPVTSVFASLLSFAEERDRPLVFVSGIVLMNLLVSLLLGLG